MTFREFFENWDQVGSGASNEDAAFAQRQLRIARVRVMRGPNINRKSIQYIGDVSEFFPRAAQVHPQLGRIPVFYDPAFPPDTAAADTNGRKIRIGPDGYKHKGSSGSLGDTFVHEIEHIWDLLNGYHTDPDQTGRAKLSEFTPRLRQMLRQLQTLPENTLCYLFHPKYTWHAEDYVGRHLNNTRGYKPTPEEWDYAVKAVQKRAKEIYDQISAPPSSHPEGS